MPASETPTWLDAEQVQASGMRPDYVYGSFSLNFINNNKDLFLKYI